MQACDNIVLIGFMGTGKSSVGKMLAKKLRCPLVDIDRQIETVQKRKISDIFAREGEFFFRTLEKQAIADFSKLRGQVITTGGGAVMDPDNLAALARHGCLVALTASPDTILRRVKKGVNRPLLKGKDLQSQIGRLLEIRRPYYEKADLSVDTDNKTTSQVASEILRALKGRGPKPVEL